MSWKVMARYVRDLLEYDPNLIRPDKKNFAQDDFDNDYIVINTSQPALLLAKGSTYDGDAEVMNYTDTSSQTFVIEFYGKNAYNNVSRFTVLNDSQQARDIRYLQGLTACSVMSQTDVKQMIGSSYGNQINVEINAMINRDIDVDTLRIDTPQIEYEEDK